MAKITFTLPITGGEGSGVTNLSYTASSTDGTVNSDTGTDASIPLADATNAGLLSPAEKIKLNNTSGINNGDQTSIAGITGTKTQFNTAVTDGDFLFVGDVIAYTDEQAQDAVGNILIGSPTIDFTYDDSTPNITATVKTNSITATELSNSINISEFINDSDYATINYVDSHSNRTDNPHNVTKSQIGLGNADNTSDLNKPISIATQTALDLKENKSEKNQINGYAGLDGSGKMFSSQLPALAITDTFVVNSQATMLNLTTAETGDIAVRTDLNKTFILKGINYSILGDWQELITPTDSVSSVFGRSGAVIANVGDYTTALVTETVNKNYQTDNQKSFNDATSSIQTQLNNRALVSQLDTDSITNNSLVAGINTTDALNTLKASIPENYTKVVYVNATNPNSATIFDLNNPPTVNNNLLKSDVANLYIGTDASTWVYNVSAYVTKAIPAVASIFYNAGTTIPATNITSPITRNGKVGFGASNPIGKVDIFTGDSGFSTGIASLPSGTISFANNNSTNQSPTISGKSTTAVGLTLISATNDSNSFPDMVFNVRKSDNTDFATITSIAYQFGRFGNILMSILRNGNVGINVIPTTTATNKLQVNGNITANTATASNHVVVKSQLDLKSDIDSPTFTGNPTAPTAPKGTNNLTIANTNFVNNLTSSGSYTPTVSASTNCVSPSALLSTYTRNGNIITLRLLVLASNFTAANTLTTMTVNLPINRTLNNVKNIGCGSGYNSSGDYWAAIAQTDANNDKMVVIFKTPSTNTGNIVLFVQYDTTQ